MTEKPVRPHEPANRDVDAAIEHYLNEASEKVALGFIDELQKVFARIRKTPALVRPGMLMSWICPTCASRQLRGIRTSCSTSSETLRIDGGPFGVDRGSEFGNAKARPLRNGCFLRSP